MDIVQRMLPLKGGKRVGLKLDPATWQAIDYLAGQRGTTWQDWCRAVIEQTAAGENVTASVRNAVMNELMAATILDGRGESVEAMAAHTLMRENTALNDSQWSEIMKMATVQGSSDFGGFTVFFGHDDSGQDCVWIRNGLRNGLHFAFIYPNKVQP